jgi:hypothetical protein
MKFKNMQEEVFFVANSQVAFKSDKQLLYYDCLSQQCNAKYKGIQPKSLVHYNHFENRATKLSKEQVLAIRGKYSNGRYGKKRLAKEYGVSVTLIYMIIKYKKWNKI